MNDELIIRGSLEESSLPELLRSMNRSRESGILTCHVNGYVKSIYLSEGQIIFAASNNVDDRLGESLLRAGKITVQQLMEGSNHIRPDRKLGAILVDTEAITPEELVEGVQHQVQEIIGGLFECTRGEYELTLRTVNTHDMIMLRMSTEDVIFDGVKSIGAWSLISQGIGSLASKLIPTEESGKTLLNLSLSAEESHLFSLCEKGKFTIDEICSMSYVSSFDTCRILYAFMMVGVLQSTETPQAPEKAPPISFQTTPNSEYDLHDLVERYNDLYSHIYEFAFSRIGEKANELAARSMSSVESAMPNVAKNLKLDTYGRLDFDTILRNLNSIPEKGKAELVTGALEEIVYSLLYEVGSQFGPTDQKHLTEEVQALRKA
jgi:Domain of unknown function (DUF4388)